MPPWMAPQLRGNGTPLWLGGRSIGLALYLVAGAIFLPPSTCATAGTASNVVDPERKRVQSPAMPGGRRGRRTPIAPGAVPPAWTATVVWPRAEPVIRSGRRGQRLALLHHVGDQNLRLGGARLAAGMGRLGRDLEPVTRLQHAGLLTLNGKFEAAFEDESRLDSGMGVASHRDARLDLRFDKQRFVSRHGTVRPRQDFSCDAGSGGGRGTLRRCLGGNKTRDRANRAGGKTCKTSSCQHDVLPAVPERSCPDFGAKLVSLRSCAGKFDEHLRHMPSGLLHSL